MPSTISSSVLPLTSHLQSFPASGSFPKSQFFTSDGQSFTVLPMNIQNWFPLGLTGLISLLLKGLSRVFSSTTLKSMNSSAFSLPYGPTLTSMCDYGKSRSSDSSVGKESSFNAGEPGSIPGLERSPGEEKGYPLQYSGLENSMDCIFHGVTKSRTWLSDSLFTHLTIWTFVSQVMSLLFNTLSRLS